jgi:hypothetical protein
MSDIISNPLDVLETLLSGVEVDKENCMDISLGSDRALPASILAKEIERLEDISQIPFLTASLYSSGKLKPYQLVRYRGIAQDFLDAEYYVGVCEAIDTASGSRRPMSCHFRDQVTSPLGTTLDLESDNCLTCERFPVLFAPVPGESSWVKSFVSTQQQDPAASQATLSSSTSSNSKQRKRESGDKEAIGAKGAKSAFRFEGEGVGSGSGSGNGSGSASIAVGQIDSDGVHEMVSGQQVLTMADSGLMDGIGNEVRQPYHSGPLDAPCCLAKFYSSAPKGVKLNDTIEMIGVLGPVVTQDDYDEPEHEQLLGDFMNDFEDGETLLPSSLSLPRLHVVSFQKLGSAYPLFAQIDDCSNGKRSAKDCKDGEDTTKQMEWRVCSPSQCALQASPSKREATVNEGQLRAMLYAANPATARANMVRSIASFLASSGVHAECIDLAAEYIMLATLSRIYHRSTEEGINLGVLGINLTGASQDTAGQFCDGLCALLSNFVPRCVKQCINIDSLNAGVLVTQKDYAKNRIIPSALQLSTGTVLLCDETALGEGQLSPRGVKSLQSLHSLSVFQHLPLEFDYFSMNLPVDVPLVIVSNPSSIIGAALTQVPLRMSSPSQSQCSMIPALSLSDSDLDCARVWWTAVRHLPVEMSADMCDAAQNEFVSARQKDPAVSADDFHAWLCLSRLLALSNCDDCISIAHFQKAVEMEAKRKSMLL